jgi:hypothetical protein
MFWRDMIAVGTALSLACLAVSLLLAASQATIWLVVIVFLLPLPYNAFIWHCAGLAACRFAMTFSRVFQVLCTDKECARK